MLRRTHHSPESSHQQGWHALGGIAEERMLGRAVFAKGEEVSHREANVDEAKFEVELKPECGDARYAVNIAVREHETTVAVDWEWAPLAKVMYRMVGVFNERLLPNQIPPPFLKFEAQPGSTLGAYRVTRGSCGAECEITLNTRFIVQASTVECLAVLAHEALHAWQHTHGNQKDRRRGGWYHNKEFRCHAERMGIPTNEMGHFLGVTERFISLLAEYGVVGDHTFYGAAQPPAQQAAAKYRKYHCGHPQHSIIRVPAGARNFAARCELCDQPYAMLLEASGARSHRKELSADVPQA